jgi:hypothetical protein
MADDLNEALCRLTQMTAEQVAGLPVVAAMSPSELAAFTGRVEDAWETNRDGIQDARDVVRSMRRERLAVEMEIADAARLRNPMNPIPTAPELDRYQTARANVAKAVGDVRKATEKFKAGVTADQLEGD